MRRRCEKRFSADRVGGRAGVPEELLEFANRKNSSEFATGLGRPVPYEQEAADLWATASSADLEKKRNAIINSQSINNAISISINAIC